MHVLFYSIIHVDINDKFIFDPSALIRNSIMQHICKNGWTRVDYTLQLFINSRIKIGIRGTIRILRFRFRIQLPRHFPDIYTVRNITRNFSLLTL